MADEPVAGASKLLGTNHLQTSVDALKTTIDHLNQGLSQVVPQLSQMNRLGRAGGFGNSGAGAYNSMPWWGNLGGQGGGQPPRGTNGGGATFGGKPAGGQGGQGGGAGGGQPSGGSGGGNQPPPTFGQRFMQASGGKAGLAVAGYQATNAAVSKMIQGGASGMLDFDLISAQLSLGGGTTRKAVQETMKGQSTGLNSADVAQGRYTLTRGLGITPGSGADQRMQSATGIAGIINPGMGNAQVASATQAVGQPEYTLKLRGLGIGPKSGQPMDTATLARDILNRIRNWQSINTAEQITAQLDNPNGSVAVTLRNYIAQGFLPAETAEVVKEEIRAILIARMNGMDFETLQKMGSDVNSPNKSTRDAAQKSLEKAGVYNPSLVQKQKNKATVSRDRDIDVTDSFAKGAGLATDALAMFTNAINAFLDKTGLGQAVGWYGGAKGVLGGGGGGGGNNSDIGAMSNQIAATGGQPDQNMSNISQGVPLASTANKSGSNSASGAPGTSSGSGKTSAGKKTIKFARPVAGRITSGFGSRKDPINGRTKTHTGIDFGASSGTPIHASAAGTVSFSGTRGANYWAGNHVIINHGGGYETLYAHQSRVKARVGATVQQGEVIGYVGSTGRATGPHLHFEIHINGHPVDPSKYLSGASVAISESTVSSSSQGTSTAGSTEATSDSASSAAMAPGGSGSGIITSELQALSGFAGAASSPVMDTGATPQDTAANNSSSSSSNASSGTDGTKVPTAPSSVSGNKAVVKQMAAQRGWTGKQWDALYQLVMHESGFRNTAQNPTSTAFGLFQFLNSTWKGYGVSKTSDPKGQTKAGLAYIADRYGNPVNAWAKWQSRSPHWYDTGAWEIPKDEEAVVHKGEMIVGAKEARQIREVLLNGTPYKANLIGAQGNGSGLHITIERGAITVTTSGGVTSSGINDLGKAIADQLAQNEKIKKLQQGVLT